MLSRCITTSLLALSSSSSPRLTLRPTCWRLRHCKMTTTSCTITDDEDNKVFTNPDDATIRTILTQTRTVAMIGASNRPERDSYHVMEYMMKECGYQVIPINPMYTGQTILNQKVYRTLSEVLLQFPNVDMIDIFRKSSEVPEIIKELIQFQQQQQSLLQEQQPEPSTTPSALLLVQQHPKYIWMQISVIDPISARWAQQHGYQVIMNKCPLREIPRLQISLPIVDPHHQ